MNHINPSKAWRKKAEDAQEDVNAGLKKVGDLSDIWGELKPEFSKLSFGKCWYCESRQDRSDNAVDHFRPKKDYPWHAFTYENYRFACSFCNSPHRHPLTGKTQGKHHHFPLFENSPRAKNEDELELEQAILLDPCNATDPGLLDFLADGTPCPKFPKDAICVRRVKESIRLYNLDHPGLVEERRLLARQLDRWIKKAHSYYCKAKAGKIDDLKSFEDRVRDIAQHLDDRAQHSAFARRMVKNHPDKPWIDLILDT